MSKKKLIKEFLNLEKLLSEMKKRFYKLTDTEKAFHDDSEILRLEHQLHEKLRELEKLVNDLQPSDFQNCIICRKAFIENEDIKEITGKGFHICKHCSDEIGDLFSEEES
jgi:regulator of replication initiation timing